MFINGYLVTFNRLKSVGKRHASSEHQELIQAFTQNY
jgi:hypothetical protein